MKQLTALLLPPGWEVQPLQGNSTITTPVSIKFSTTEYRDRQCESKVSFPRKQRNDRDQPKVQTTAVVLHLHAPMQNTTETCLFQA